MPSENEQEVIQLLQKLTAKLEQHASAIEVKNQSFRQSRPQPSPTRLDKRFSFDAYRTKEMHTGRT